MPTFIKYDGITDSHEHICQYRQVMIMTVIPSNARDAIMCKLFIQSLKGLTFKWFFQLPSRTIGSFKEMTKIFIENYSVNIKLGGTLEELCTIVQQPKESLQDYIRQFSIALVLTPNCNDFIALFAFKIGLLLGSSFLDEILQSEA
ncbi:hypothetical protein TIFTF001_016867 [Ficus carica]|uniref:Retrotransposon gag domain-containing protein n=1 Tax=Ficus carica TaxID=3494 RepID=A0AA88A3X6_FICCA|nr:hypothetical protein TIFTF001_016867 [Ficus carica]